MYRLASLFFTAALAVAALVACQTSPAAQARPVAGFVTDMKAFDDFIATKPTPERFRATYPDVILVTPDMMSTREMRQNNSRYFPQLDDQGRIIGGRFM